MSKKIKWVIAVVVIIILCISIYFYKARQTRENVIVWLTKMVNEKNDPNLNALYPELIQIFKYRATNREIFQVWKELNSTEVQTSLPVYSGLLKKYGYTGQMD